MMGNYHNTATARVVLSLRGVAGVGGGGCRF